MASSSTRNDVLEAASQVLDRHGAKHLTIEAVAREAGVSKGGVLYHFRTKAELIRAVVLFYLESLEADIEMRIAAEEPGPGRLARAFLAHHAAKPLHCADGVLDMLAMVGHDPELREMVGQFRRRLLSRMQDDGLDPTLVTLLFCAAEGMMFAEILDLDPRDVEHKADALALGRRLTFPGAWSDRTAD
jgi:AcrR family transcriptional regulator